MADDAGALLVRSGLVPASALDDARARVASAGGTVGEQLVAGGLLGDDTLTDFYKSRLLVPQVNPNTLARLPAKVVALIPTDMAIELRAIPVSLDKDNNLTIAMSDPSDRHAVDEISFFTGAYVVRAVATQMQIAWCLAHYYGHVTALGQRLLQPNAKGPTPALAAAVRQPRTRGVTGKVNALRRHALVPGESVETARPNSAEIEAAPAPEPEATPDPEVGGAIPQPRARSVSGEIRAQRHPRAPSIRPELPDFEHESGPVISLEADEPSAPHKAPDAVPERVIEIEADAPGGDEQTDVHKPAPPLPKRKRPAEPDPPELAARAGELQMKAAPIRVQIARDEESTIVVDVDLAGAPAPEIPGSDSRAPTAELPRSATASGEIGTKDDEPAVPEPVVPTAEASEPVVIHQAAPPEEPILLENRRDASAPVPVEDEPSDVIVLAPKKAPGQPAGRSASLRASGKRPRDTQVGIGPVTAATRVRTESDAPAADTDPTRLDARAVPPGDYTTSDEILAAPPSPLQDDDNTSPIAMPPSPVGGPPPSGKVSLDNVVPRGARPDDDEDDVVPVRHSATEVMTAVQIDEAVGAKVPRSADFDNVDDGWGPPGTTIPPPLLGEIPGSNEPKSGMIPLPDVDTAPLMVAPPRAPEAGSRPDISPQNLTRALEETAGQVLDVIRALDTARERDQVVTVMVAHLAQSHRRAGFFALRGGELTLFALSPPPNEMPSASMRIDRPSTLQDVVGTRLPYRGPMHDDTSRAFLAAVLGASPPEILLVPVTVRERVVGVLFGEQRMRHTFDDQLALAARAAGMALERILKSKVR